MRFLILILLVVILPAAVYWAVNGMAGPAETWERFAGQVDDIRRSQPDDPEPDPEPIRTKDPEREPEEKPAEPEPRKRTPEPAVPRTDPATLFAQGKFEQAAAAFDDSRPRARALAQLGAAFRDAFPEPTELYLVVELKGGSTQEGYAIADGEELKLLDPTGRAIGLPKSLVVGRRSLEPNQVAERTLPRIRKEVESGDARRLFRATTAAFRIGRPEIAAPLLEKIVNADSGAILKAITKDVAPLARDSLFRAYTDAKVTRDPRPEPTPVVVRNDPATTKRDNPLKLNGRKKSTGRNSKFNVTDAKAREYMVQARPLRLEGKRLYDKVYVEGLDKADVADVEEAIRKYEAALALYEKALEREDDDTIYVLVTGCSKKLFQLRFWKEQLSGR